ncbi:hypothetical protein AKJ50_00220 [candidate division MSBL1 archaeon SCGC-AAA382A13]|uniref:Uncharacterized protein n=1 Tax=candidate division MSBL1 archaeon SCGC-AAA382A13 TaxID=1698279 RepID=A0A133VGY7_9EURY|nr:hypothetical protein AKJ50_00220 [candidate division MSBL1 archaeon SCGC-AAA382A13]
MRGQGSIEYLSIISAVFVIFAAVTFTQMISPGSNLADDTEQLGQARAGCDVISDAINGVYTSNDSVFTEIVEFSRSWSLQLENDNVRIGVEISDGMTWVDSNVKYGFESGVHDFGSGSYAVIVERGDSDEVVMMDGEKKIFIRINPGG